jgi:peptidoglycan/LPS O-acetylase OafA/YrhL
MASQSAAARIRDIDALRCFAMFGVMAQHAHILPIGWIGVWLFFVISGFVVTHSLIGAPSLPTRRDWLSAFYGRRAARILPIYYLYVGAAAVVSAVVIGMFEWRPFASMVLFYNNFEASLGNGWFKFNAVGHLWTISVEMQFYLVFGFAFCFLSRRDLTRLLVALLVACPLGRLAASLILQQVSGRPLEDAYVVYTMSFLHFDAFAAGALLALHRERLCEGKAPFRLLAAGAAAAIVYTAVYVVRNVTAYDARGLDALRNIFSGIMFGDYREVIGYNVVVLAAAGLVATAVSGRAPWRPILQVPLIRHIGKISYGAYVYHIAVLWAVETQVSRVLPDLGQSMAATLERGVIVFAISAPIVVLVAHASYRWIETPFLRRAHRAAQAPARALA